jgi:hypothetical protein
LSQLQKAIERIQRREGPRMGFSQAMRETPRAMLAGIIVNDAGPAKEMLAQGADVVIVRAKDATEAAARIAKVENGKAAIGALLTELDEAGAEALAKAKCDFVISPLEATTAEAVDTDRMGHVISAHRDLDDNTLRALGPLGLNALYVERAAGAMTMAGRLDLVRLATFTNTPLLVTVGTEAGVPELRVLRDSGVAAVIAPEGTTGAQMEKLFEALKAVPAPKRERRGSDIAIVPAMGGGRDEEEEDDDHDH